MSSSSELILFADTLTDSDLAVVRQEAEKTGIQFREAGSERPLTEQLDGATAIVTRSADIPQKVIQAASDLQYIMYEDFGSAVIDREAAEARGIPVINLVNLGWLGVSEHTILLMLSLMKQLPDAHFKTSAGERKPGVSEVKTTAREYTFSWLGQENLGWLYRKRLALVGAGRIARGVAARAKAFGMQVRYYAPTKADEAIEQRYGMSYSSLDDILPWADFVSLHASLTPQSSQMFGSTQFSSMRNDAYFVNTARGGLVDEEALIAALQSGQIAGAGLDVFEYEPVKKDNPLLGMDNVILTPHSAGIFNDDARVAQLREAFDRVKNQDSKDYLA